MSNKEKDNDVPTTHLSRAEKTALAVLMLAVLGLSLSWYQIMMYTAPAELRVADSAKAAELIGVRGDSYGALNTLFSGLALIGLFVAIRLQTKELSGQGIQLREQQEEIVNQNKLMRSSLRVSARTGQVQAMALIMSAKIAGIDHLRDHNFF